ncbi:MAG: hypothetical protein OXQ29_10805 [Rhodospirillaceae bacterium]|nr:hypothetical protein [Rhodospirillaceae bacterium]
MLKVTASRIQERVSFVDHTAYYESLTGARERCRWSRGHRSRVVPRAARRARRSWLSGFEILFSEEFRTAAARRLRKPRRWTWPTGRLVGPMDCTAASEDCTAASGDAAG